MNLRSPRKSLFMVSAVAVLSIGLLSGCGATKSASSANTPSSSSSPKTSTTTTSKTSSDSAAQSKTKSPSSSSTSTNSSSGSSSNAKSKGSNSTNVALFTNVVSNQSFDSTVSTLKKAISKNGMMVLGNLNQAGALKTTGLKLKGAESFFVGNPVMGKNMFQMNAAVGADIPVRVYVWVDQNGKTHVGYLQPSEMLSAINSKMKKPGSMLDKKVGMIIKGLSGSSTSSSNSSTQQIQFIKNASNQSFDATVTALKHAVSKNGMMVLGNLNQAGALKTTGLKLKGAESFFVGNPVMGKTMFQMNAAVGADVPVRVYVWVDQNGKTQVGYFQPSTVLKQINPKFAKPGSMLDKKLSMIVKVVSK